MRTLKFLLKKEFGQLFRRKSLLVLMTIAPLIQLLILPLAANYEIKNINLAIVDHDHSPYSQKLIEKLRGSAYFNETGYCASFEQAMKLIEADKADIIIEIPKDFETGLVREGSQKILLAANAINGPKALIGSGYLGQVIGNYNKDIVLDWVQPGRFNKAPEIEITGSSWYNPHLSYYVFMVPGLMVTLLSIVAGFMASLNIVREKEVGTIEQVNVSPIQKHIFILGKLIPFWIIGMVVFTLALLVARFVYGIIPVGSLLLLYGYIAVFLVAMLGFGLLVSTYSENQQQAISVAYLFILIFLLMSGVFTPVESMPEWGQVIAFLSPVTHSVAVLRMLVLKGSSLKDILPHLSALLAIGVVLNGWAVINYRKTS